MGELIIIRAIPHIILNFNALKYPDSFVLLEVNQ